jgi:hypothetical protein
MEKKYEWCLVHRRALHHINKWNPKCDCGSDPNNPHWHEPRCRLEAAWDRAVEIARDELADEPIYPCGHPLDLTSYDSDEECPQCARLDRDEA